VLLHRGSIPFPSPKTQGSNLYLQAADLTVNLHFYSKLTCAPIKYALSYVNIQLHVLVIFVTITRMLCNI